MIHSHRAVEHPVRILDVTDGQNIDGKPVAFVSGTAFEIEFLHRTFIDGRQSMDLFGEKYVVGDIGGCSIKSSAGVGIIRRLTNLSPNCIWAQAYDGSVKSRNRGMNTY